MLKFTLLKKKIKKFSDFLRTNKMDLTNIKKFHSKYITCDPFTKFSKNTPNQTITKYINLHKKNFEKLKKKYDQKKIENLQETIKQRTDKSSEEIPEKIGEYYYISRTKYEQDRDYINLYRYKNKKKPTKILDPIKDGIINKKHHKTFTIEKLTISDNSETMAILVDLENKEKPKGFIKNLTKNLLYKKFKKKFAL